jgi:hypothetical protein
MSGPRTTAKALALVGAIAASFTIGWIVRGSGTGPDRQPVVREPYRASHEEKIMAARILVAVNKRRGVATPAWIVELAAKER